MTIERDLRYFCNYYHIINKFLLMRVSIETCYCIPENLCEDDFGEIGFETINKLKQITESLYSDIGELTKLYRYKKDLRGIILRKYPFLDVDILDKIISNWMRHYYC